MANSLMDLLAGMGRAGASDLFITEGKHPAVRIHGQLRNLDQPPTSRELIQSFLEQVLTPLSRNRFTESGDLDVGVALPDGRRCEVHPERHHLPALGRI
jgi:twitching motility protein PilT